MLLADIRSLPPPAATIEMTECRGAASSALLAGLRVAFRGCCCASMAGGVGRAKVY